MVVSDAAAAVEFLRAVFDAVGRCKPGVRRKCASVTLLSW
jgi:hypothetical protein